MTTPLVPADRPTTLGALRASGYTSVPVRDEMRSNLEERLIAGEPLVSGVLGYDDSVLPQLETALLAGHDIILLGERGQAKTRLIRALVDLLDEWLPFVEGSEVRDDPYAPISAYALDLVAQRGDETPIAWVHRSQRFAEKLASPDTSMADLIGEVDPIKVAGGLYLDDPRALSYGLVPKSNRGIFSMNELPDLAERIQVGLLNVLEERDVQIRGHLVRLDLDVVVVATANPEDYTNRGRLITPLKDRFGSQIRTHYPDDVETEMAIVLQEARLPASPKPIIVPWFINDVVSRISHVARRSHVISQRSGVSVRLSIANFETVVASALRRTLRTGDDAVVPRVSDLAAIVQSTQGKIELDTMEEDDLDQVIAALAGLALRQCFAEYVVLEEAADIVEAFQGEVLVHTGDDLADAAYLEVLAALPVLETPVKRVAGADAGPGELAAATEFVLEGLYLTKRLAKDASGSRALFPRPHPVVPVRYGFRRFGEGDDFDDLDVDELLSLLADDYMESGDLDEAMDRLLREGYVTRDGQRVEGLRELLERTRARRRELESQADPDGELSAYRERLEAIEALETSELDELLAEAEASGDERRAEVTRDVVENKRVQRELMSDRLGERLRDYQDYEFVSTEAREQFDEMMDELRRDALNTYFEQSKEFLGSPDPEELARLREMMDALSTMIEQDRAGESLDPTFESFMERFGDYFPGAESLEDVVRMMAERAAAAEAMFNSLSADQQRELRGLFDQMMGDMSLDLSLSRLVSNLRQATPDIDWGRAHRMRGGTPSSFADATSVAEQLGDLRGLEDYLSSSHAAQQLPEVDIEAVRRNLGDDAARHVERLQRAVKGLRDQGFVDRQGNRLMLSAKGVRQIGQSALRDLFAQLRNSPTLGAHREASVSRGGDREETSKPWAPGEPFSLHLSRTLRNAVLRQGPGTPVRLHPDDFEVEEYESTRRSATVFAIDLSLSMAMRSNLVPAKKMVLALTQLITARFPRDFVAVVGFGETARELKVEDVPALTIDYNYGTNLQHALALSRHLMRNERGDRQIVVVTDGEPTAHLTEHGEPFFAWPPVRETLERTMAEVLRCTKAGIQINTFALDIERSQFPFVEQIAKVNGGRTFYTSVDELGRYALDDFVRHRRAG